MKVKNNLNHIKRAKGDTALNWVTIVLLVVVLIIVGYPLLYVISASFSSSKALAAGRVLLWPVDATLDGYEFVMQYKDVWVGFKNSVIYTACGVTATMLLTIFLAFPLSRRRYQGRSFIAMFFTIAMMTSPGMIPNFLIRTQVLGLYENPLAVILQGAIGLSGIMIMRTAFNAVPEDLYEAAEIDGASPFYQMFRIGVPLSKATIGVLTLYAFVGCWNDYFSAMLYLPDPAMQPLSLVLRNILTAAQTLDTASVSSSAMMALIGDGTQQVKYCLIIVSTVPVLLMYALVQKNFKKGMMIGAVKG